MTDKNGGSAATLETLCLAAQFMDAVKPDAVKEGWWTEHDDNVRLRITTAMQSLDTALHPISAGEGKGDAAETEAVREARLADLDAKDIVDDVVERPHLFISSLVAVARYARELESAKPEPVARVPVTREQIDIALEDNLRRVGYAQASPQAREFRTATTETIMSLLASHVETRARGLTAAINEARPFLAALAIWCKDDKGNLVFGKTAGKIGSDASDLLARLTAATLLSPDANAAIPVLDTAQLLEKASDV